MQSQQGLVWPESLILEKKIKERKEWKNLLQSWGGKGDLIHGVTHPGDKGIHIISVSLKCYA